MNFQEQIQQIFGTTDIYELKQISRDADNYRCLKADMNNSSISEKKKNNVLIIQCANMPIGCVVTEHYLVHK